MVEAWKTPNTFQNLVIKVQNMLKQFELDLKKWSVNKGCNYASAITLKSARLQQLQDNEDASDVEEIKILQQDLAKLMGQEGLRWRQRAKKNWYKHGDKNTVFSCLCQSMKEEEHDKE